MGRRIDVVLIIRNVIFVVEFKVGEKDFYQSAVDQVWDYALDLKNFHEMKHKNLGNFIMRRNEIFLCGIPCGQKQ